MTNWEVWLRSKNRKDIICAVETEKHGGSCVDGKCILSPVCSKPISDPQTYRDECERFLDSEHKMERSAVIHNLGVMKKNMESVGFDEYVATLTRAIELLEGEQ